MSESSEAPSVLEFDNLPISLTLMQLVQSMRRKMNEPKFNLVEMAYKTGIDMQSLYIFRRGATNNPRIDTLDKMVQHLMPEVKIKVEKDAA